MTTDHTALATKEELATTVTALTNNNFLPEVLATKEAALARVKELIPAGSSVMNGASKTLEQIGYIEYLKAGDHGWKNLHEEILKETDTEKQAELRKYSVVSDFYIGSAHVITEKGEVVVASNTGSQLPHLAFTSPNLVLVVSTKKLVPTLTEAFDRIDSHIVPLEEVRMKEVYGFGTTHAKTLILHKENPGMGRKVHVLFVEEDLGF
ncbi:MAG: lactate utilization protein [Patescibacteria group bacterium]